MGLGSIRLFKKGDLRQWLYSMSMQLFFMSHSIALALIEYKKSLLSSLGTLGKRDIVRYPILVMGILRDAEQKVALRYFLGLCK
jgi:hypothetical protein